MIDGRVHGGPNFSPRNPRLPRTQITNFPGEIIGPNPEPTRETEDQAPKADVPGSLWHPAPGVSIPSPIPETRSASDLDHQDEPATGRLTGGFCLVTYMTGPGFAS